MSGFIVGKLNEGRMRASFRRGPVAQLRERRPPAECRKLKAIFPEGVPVTAMLPETVQLEGRGNEPVFFLDVNRVTEAQLQEVAEYVIGVCGTGTPSEVLGALANGVPMPVRASLIASVCFPLGVFL